MTTRRGFGGAGNLLGAFLFAWCSPAGSSGAAAAFDKATRVQDQQRCQAASAASPFAPGVAPRAGATAVFSGGRASKSMCTASELAEQTREASGKDQEAGAKSPGQDTPTTRPTTPASQPSTLAAETESGGKSKTLAGAFRRLVLGEPEEEEEEDEEEEPQTQPSALTEVAPERFVTGRKSMVQISGYQAREFDVDGDGKPELIMPSWQGEVAIVSADGAKVRKLRLRGIGMNTSIMGVRPVRLDGALDWLVSCGSFSGIGGQGSATVGLFDDQGARLWQYRLPGGKRMNVNASVAAGDLTGDGVPEFVVGVTVAKMKKMSENSWTYESQRGYLVVLDAKGAPLACKRIGQSADFVAVAEADSAGKRAILLFENGTMHRLYYDAAASTQPAKEDAEDEEVDEDEE